MEKETSINTVMTKQGEDMHLDLKMQGDFIDLIYLYGKIGSRLKAKIVEKGIPEDKAKEGLLWSIEKALNTFD